MYFWFLFYFLVAVVFCGRFILCLSSKATDSKDRFDFILEKGACLYDFPY